VYNGPPRAPCPSELARGPPTLLLTMRSDHGFTHVALPVGDIEASLDFYRRYADMDVVHRRRDEATGEQVVWVSDRTRPFVIVLIEHRSAVARSGSAARDGEAAVAAQQDRPSGLLTGFSHLGIGCDSREEIDRRTRLAREEGRTVRGPFDSGPPVGYWAFISDPDGNNLELSHGQEVGITVEEAGPA
jgi:catechol 2,3-dioxygenase-like lactoylglutathione lyase family enzyme